MSCPARGEDAGISRRFIGAHLTCTSRGMAGIWPPAAAAFSCSPACPGRDLVAPVNRTRVLRSPFHALFWCRVCVDLVAPERREYLVPGSCVARTSGFLDLTRFLLGCLPSPGEFPSPFHLAGVFPGPSRCPPSVSMDGARLLVCFGLGAGHASYKALLGNQSALALLGECVLLRDLPSVRSESVCKPMGLRWVEAIAKDTPKDTVVLVRHSNLFLPGILRRSLWAPPDHSHLLPGYWLDNRWVLVEERGYSQEVFDSRQAALGDVKNSVEIGKRGCFLSAV